MAHGTTGEPQEEADVGRVAQVRQLIEQRVAAALARSQPFHAPAVEVESWTATIDLDRSAETL